LWLHRLDFHPPLAGTRACLCFVGAFFSSSSISRNRNCPSQFGFVRKPDHGFVKPIRCWVSSNGLKCLVNKLRPPRSFLPANRHDFPSPSNHIGTVRLSFETMPAGPDHTPAAETWPPALDRETHPLPRKCLSVPFPHKRALNGHHTIP
jgi:hypothetical protein